LPQPERKPLNFFAPEKNLVCSNVDVTLGDEIYIVAIKDASVEEYGSWLIVDNWCFG